LPTSVDLLGFRTAIEWMLGDERIVPATVTGPEPLAVEDFGPVTKWRPNGLNGQEIGVVLA
jgi:hypothetical protein